MVQMALLAKNNMMMCRKIKVGYQAKIYLISN